MEKITGCYNLTHYSICGYCSFTHKCKEYREKYYRNKTITADDKIRYNYKLKTYMFNLTVMDIVDDY